MKLLKKYSYQKLATTNAFLAIGYLDILNHCANNTPLDLAKIQQKSRQYAKRQIT
jgi:tRNA A37 N6-isopentenylltransferase MiaA